jgi:hypothetical protein
MLTPDDRQRLAEMRQAAEQATQGPYAYAMSGPQPTVHTLSGTVVCDLYRGYDLPAGQPEANAAHIASASPDRVLWLLDLVERMTPMPRCSICRSDDCRQDHACE